MRVPEIISTVNITHLLWTGIAMGLLHIQICIGCPEDAVTEVYACLRNLVGDDGNMKVLAGDDANEFYQKCVDGSFDFTVLCVQNVLTQCRGTPQEKKLQNTLDPNVMKKAFDTACEKKDHYMKTSKCVARYKDRIQSCCKSIQREFFLAKEEAHSVEKYMDLMCSFIHGITGCTEAPIRRFCDATTAGTIIDFISGITPVTCIPYRNKACDITVAISYMLASLGLLHIMLRIYF